MRPAIVSGIVTGYAPVSYWSIFPCPWGESQRSLRRSRLGPVSFSIQKWRIRVDVAPPAMKLRRRRLVSKTTYASNL